MKKKKKKYHTKNMNIVKNIYMNLEQKKEKDIIKIKKSIKNIMKKIKNTAKKLAKNTILKTKKKYQLTIKFIKVNI